MKVLSLFNGMGCIWLALDRIGVTVTHRYSCEIDKYANKVNDANYPDTIQLGSVVDVKGSDLGYIDLLVGGSPCQGFSFAGKGLNFEDTRSKLFFEFVRIYHELREINPNIKFMLENVRMKSEHETVISRMLEISPLYINSTLMSAQNRQRLYWTNIYNKPTDMFGNMYCMIPQPKDKGIFLRDIIEFDVDEKYYLSEKTLERVLGKIPKINPDKSYAIVANNNTGSFGNDRSATLIKEPFGALNDKGNLREVTNNKSTCIDANYWKGIDNHAARTMIVAMRGRNIVDGKRQDYLGAPTEQRLEPNLDDKTNCLTSVQKDNLVIQLNQSKESGGKQPYQQNRIYSTEGKSPCLQAELSSKTHAIEIKNTRDLMTDKYNVEPGYRIRRLTEIECERLQTVPDIAKNVIFELCYESAKSYVNVVNKSPKLLKLVLDAEKTELNEIVKNAILNMNASLQSIKCIALQSAGMLIPKEINQCIKDNLQENSIIASNVATTAMCNVQNQEVDFALQNVFINIIEGKITHFGKEELAPNGNLSTIQKNGNNPLRLFGKEIIQLVEDAEISLNIKKDSNFIYITSHHLNIKNLEQALIIYYLFAKNAITGYTQDTIPIKILLLNFNLKDGYTNHVSSTQRYKMLGNGWTVSVIAHILSHLSL